MNVIQKIWREIKRPFRQGLRLLNHSLRFTKRKSTEENKTIVPEVNATESIVPKILESQLKTPGFAAEFYNELGQHFTATRFRGWHDQETWDNFFDTQSGELRKLQSRLVANTDELSHEIVAREIARRRFYSERMPFPIRVREDIWKIFLNTSLPLIYQLDYEEKERIRVLGKTYQANCPYKLPPTVEGALPMEHLATGFGFLDFPLEIQKKVTGKDIIDGGGYLGDSPMVFTEYEPRKVYTFEPNPYTIPAMEKVLMENARVLGARKERIEIVPLALGGSKGVLTFQTFGKSHGAARVVSSGEQNANTCEVNVISIDEFVQERALEVGLIKLDVEGVEYDTILGAKETITRQKPLLLISIYHTFKDFFEIKPLIESWELGYKFEIRQHQTFSVGAEFALVAY